MSDILKLDQNGYEEFLQDIERLEKELKDLRYYKGTDAIYQGDLWHDNPALDYAEMQERMLMRNIRLMKEQLRYIEIVERGVNVNAVDLNSICLLEIIFSENKKEEMMVKLVGTSPKIDTEVKEVSINSPLGGAIYGKKENEQGYYEVNGRNIRVFIKKVIR